MDPHVELKNSPISNNLQESDMLDGSMKLQDFLLEDYKHGSAFIMQILQDITAALNLYFLLLAIFVSGIGVAYQFNIINQPVLSPLIAVLLLGFGIIHFFFFVRFVSFGLVYNETTDRINGIRDFYVQQFQTQIPTIKNVLGSYTGSGSYYTIFLPMNSLLAFMLALAASLCFAGAAFLSSELVFDINKRKILPLPTDLRPYIIALVIGGAAFLFQTYYYRYLQNKAKTLKAQ